MEPISEKMGKKAVFSAYWWDETTTCYDRAFHVYSVMKRGPFSPVFRLLPLLLAGFMAQALYRPFPWDIKKASAISMRQLFYVSIRVHGRFASAIC